MEKIVKFRLIDFFARGPNPLEPDKEIMFSRQAVHGQTVSTEDSGPDANVVYGLSEKEAARLEALGAFFTDAEIEAMEAGVSDMAGSTEGGDHVSSIPYAGIGRDPGGPNQPHPLTFDQYTAEMFAVYMDEAQPSPQELLSIVEQSGDQTATGDKILAAEAALSGGESREELVEGVMTLLGRGTGTGPEGSEGVEGTAPDEPSTTSNGEDGPTESAVAYAKEESVDLEDVTGTGRGGRVTKPDVEKYVASRGS